MGDIEDEDCAVCIADVSWNEASEFLLSGCVPQL